MRRFNLLGSLPLAGGRIAYCCHRPRGKRSLPALCWSLVVQGCAHPRLPPQRAYKTLDIPGRPLLPVTGTGRPGDALVHERTTQIIRPGREAGGNAIAPHLHPGGLYIVDKAVQHQTRHRVHQQGFTERGASTCAALEVHRRFHMHERQGHKFGEAACAALQVAHRQQMRRPVMRAINMPVHDGCSAPQTLIMRGLHHLQPLRGIQFVRAQFGTYFIVQNLCRCSRQCFQPGFTQCRKKRGDIHAQRFRALPDFQR